MLRNIIPINEVGKKKQKFYQNGDVIEITPFGIYVPFSTILTGWIYKNLKRKVIDTGLIEGVDYILI